MTNSTAKTLVAVSVLFALAACNTIQGAGRDIEKAGSAISEAAE